MWKNRRQGKTTDVYGGAPPGGEVKIEMIGKEGVVALEKVPVNTITDQLAAAVHLPGVLLGITQAQTASYKLTDHQVQMIVSKVQAYRNDYFNVKKQIVEMHLALRGLAGAIWRWVWDEINLMDVAEHAKAELDKRQAQKTFVEMLVLLMENVLIDDRVFLDAVIGAGIIPESQIKSYGGPEGIRAFFYEKMKYQNLKTLLDELKN
jgi:hypothetical protein